MPETNPAHLLGKNVTACQLHRKNETYVCIYVLPGV